MKIISKAWETECYTSRIADHKEVLYCDYNKKSDGVTFIRNTIINKNICNHQIMLLVIYLYFTVAAVILYIFCDGYDAKFVAL